jgi:hypothetical protein
MDTPRSPTVVPPNYTILMAGIRKKALNLGKDEPHHKNQPITKFFFTLRGPSLTKEPDMDERTY